MRHLALVPALLLCAAGTGQELTEASAAESPRAAYGALLEEFEKANKEWMGSYRQAARDGDEKTVEKLLAERPNAEFARRFLEAAMAVEGDGAAPYLAWIVTNGHGAEDERRQAIELILESHVQHENMEGVAQYLRYGATSVGKDQARKLLDAIVDRNPHEDVVEAALFSRATMDQRYGKMTDADIEQACSDLERLLGMEIDDRTKQGAEGALFEYRTLMVGMTAPEIEGEDLDGVPFKLSDYRGKVVVLDFWGDW